MIAPENNPENNKDKEVENKKTVYKETDNQDENEKDAGDSSSAADIGRTDFIKRPERRNSPLGSGHEPGIAP